MSSQKVTDFGLSTFAERVGGTAVGGVSGGGLGGGIDYAIREGGGKEREVEKSKEEEGKFMKVFICKGILPFLHLKFISPKSKV